MASEKILKQRTINIYSEQATSFAVMIYFLNHGFCRYILISVRVRRAKSGLNAALRQKNVYHLWLHSTNLASEIETIFAGLRFGLD